MSISLFYGTNRNHQGSNRWAPESYGSQFSHDGMENLRFGKVTVEVDNGKIKKYLKKETTGSTGDGEALSGYLTGQVKKNSKIKAYREKINPKVSEKDQVAKLGSIQLFSELKKKMDQGYDVLIYIHGFNVSWEEAVASGLALQEMLNKDNSQKTLVFLFSWPSDGSALPFVAYRSDRTEAAGSGQSFGRGILKLRDYLMSLKSNICNQKFHLLCHSMGNYVFESSLKRIEECMYGKNLPVIFDNVFLCSPDIDEDAFENGKPLENADQITKSLSIYYNQGDLAMYISDYTKGNPSRLGHSGVSKPQVLHHKINQFDCSEIVSGVVEHSYYLNGLINLDIRNSIFLLPLEDRIYLSTSRSHLNSYIFEISKS